MMPSLIINYTNELLAKQFRNPKIVIQSKAFLTNNHNEKQDEAAKKFVAKWYAIAGEKGANSAFKSLDQIKYVGGSNYVHLNIDDIQSLPKTADKLQQHFATTNPELAQTWSEVFAGLPKQELTRTAPKTEQSVQVGDDISLPNSENIAVTTAKEVTTLRVPEVIIEKQTSKLELRQKQADLDKLLRNMKMSYVDESSEIVSPPFVKSTKIESDNKKPSHER